MHHPTLLKLTFLIVMNKYRSFIISRLSLDVFIVAAGRQSARKLRWHVPLLTSANDPPHPPSESHTSPVTCRNPLTFATLAFSRLVLAPSICFYATSASEKPVKALISSPSHHIHEGLPLSQMFTVCWCDRDLVCGCFVEVKLISDLPTNSWASVDERPCPFWEKKQPGRI